MLIKAKIFFTKLNLSLPVAVWWSPHVCLRRDYAKRGGTTCQSEVRNCLKWPSRLEFTLLHPVWWSPVSLRVHYCKRDGIYFTTLLWQNNGRQNGLIIMLFSELYKIIAPVSNSKYFF